MPKDKQDGLVQKIKKLLRLANDAGATEGEAAAAMGKVHELLAQHNLDMSVVEGPDDVEERVQGHKGRTTNKNNKWETHLYSGAADLNFCFYYVNVLRTSASGTVTGIQHVTIGKPVNVMAAELLGDYLRDTVNRMAKELKLTEPVGHLTPEFKEQLTHFMAFQMSGVSEAMYRHKYKQGVALKLRHRCKELKELRAKKPTTSATGNLPALQDAYDAAQKAIEAWLKAAKLGLTAKSDRTNKNSHALRAGYQDGDKVNLDHQVTGPSHGGISLEYRK